MDCYTLSNERPPGVRCSLAASCQRGMVLGVEADGDLVWEVVGFGKPHTLLATFKQLPEAMAFYGWAVKGEPV